MKICLGQSSGITKAINFHQVVPVGPSFDQSTRLLDQSTGLLDKSTGLTDQCACSSSLCPLSTTIYYDTLSTTYAPSWAKWFSSTWSILLLLEVSGSNRFSMLEPPQTYLFIERSIFKENTILTRPLVTGPSNSPLDYWRYCYFRCLLSTTTNFIEFLVSMLLPSTIPISPFFNSENLFFFLFELAKNIKDMW